MKTDLVIPKNKLREKTMANATEQPSGGPPEGYVSEEVRRLKAQKRAGIERQKQALALQREHILSQRTSHPARRASLEAALAQIESQLVALG
jgi:hypothetical protein